MQKTVFVVDDNDTNLVMAKSALKGAYRVFTLPSAEKMFAFIDKVMPDLILLDIEMPGMTGFEATDKLKQNPAYAKVPVVFLTGTDDIAGIGEYKDKSAGLIKKPFDAEDLFTGVNALIG